MGAEGSGTAYNPDYERYPGVDCANFVSQALIYSGLDFNGSKGAETIGKGEKAGKKGFPGVKAPLSELFMQHCFEIITDPTQAQPGDIISSTKNRHVVIYGGNNSYYGHTNDRCESTTRDYQMLCCLITM